MSERVAMDDGAQPLRANVSALMDGECSALDAQALCRAWQADADVREDWHAFHLIGDVLRSEELAGRGGDTLFLAKLHERLAEEPVVLAPLPLSEPPASGARRRALRRWTAPLGAAAGVALVAGAVWVTRPQQLNADESGAAQLAGNGSLNGAAPGNRDATAQFGRYVSAHKQFQPAAPAPSGGSYLRSAVYEANDR